MAETPRFLLYAYWRTSAAYRVRVALALKGLAWEERFVDIDKGENRSPEFLRLNPLGGVPAFFDREGGRPDGVLTQSLAFWTISRRSRRARRCCHPTPSAGPACGPSRPWWRPTATLS